MIIDMTIIVYNVYRGEVEKPTAESVLSLAGTSHCTCKINALAIIFTIDMGSTASNVSWVQGLVRGFLERPQRLFHCSYQSKWKRN